jgi:L-fuculose-phosphate aldolase
MTPYRDLREQVAEIGRRMYAAGLVVGTCGNVSARVPGENLFVITPSSMQYADIGPEDVVLMDMEGNALTEGRPPSSEAGLHRTIYRVRPDVGGVLHTHSTYASVLAVLRRPLPPILEELVIFLGGTVEVAEYGAAGSEELIEKTIKALSDRSAVLLANHGAVSVGRDLQRAFDTALIVEQAAHIYLAASSVGTPTLLPQETIELQRSMYEYLLQDSMKE